MESLKNPENIRNEGLKRFETIAAGNKNDDRHRQGFQVLLEFDVLVGGQQRVELGGRLLKERTIAEARPAHFRYGMNVVADQQVRQRPGQRFIEEESHETSAGPLQFPAPPRLVLE